MIFTFFLTKNLTENAEVSADLEHQTTVFREEIIE